VWYSTKQQESFLAQKARQQGDLVSKAIQPLNNLADEASLKHGMVWSSCDGV
jgi:hypothetical protein